MYNKKFKAFVISYKKKTRKKTTTNKYAEAVSAVFVILKKEFNRFQKIMDANKNNAYLPHLGKFFDT